MKIPERIWITESELGSRQWKDYQAFPLAVWVDGENFQEPVVEYARVESARKNGLSASTCEDCYEVSVIRNSDSPKLVKLCARHRF